MVQMISRPLRIALIVVASMLPACDSGYLYLVKQPHATIPRDAPGECLDRALAELAAGPSPLTPEERALFQGHDTRNFLSWRSLSGPRIVVDWNGHISEAKPLFPVLDGDKVTLAERYVLCLLRSGYVWPDPGGATRRSE